MNNWESINKIEISNVDDIVIYGAGPAGKVNAAIIRDILGITNYCFCDRDEKKWNSDLPYPIISVEEAAKRKKPVFILGFYNNDMTKIESALSLLRESGIEQSAIRLIDMEDEFYNSIYANYLEKYISKMQGLRGCSETINKVERIRFLSGGFNAEKEEKGGGGPIGVICMQKKILGEYYKNVKLEYPYYNSNSEYENPINRFPYMTGAIQEAYNIASSSSETIYVVNDIFSAFGVYCAGKPYVVIFHAQGDVVNEMLLWGEKLTDIEKELIQQIEIVTVENAVKVLFPSKGAEYYFNRCFKNKINFKKGTPMYNTVTDIPLPEHIEGIEKKDDIVTFLSIGQMTKLKGMDLVPDFLGYYYEKTKKKIRWIVVAGGVLKEEVDKKMNILIQKSGGDVEYINIYNSIPHSQIFYLFSISDVYLLLHRVSIFDFATLEAMVTGKGIILSDILGNKEFNIANNILLVNDKTTIEDIETYINDNKMYGELNKRVYDETFSINQFKEMYDRFLKDFISSVEV